MPSSDRRSKKRQADLQKAASKCMKITSILGQQAKTPMSENKIIEKQKSSESPAHIASALVPSTTSIAGSASLEEKNPSNKQVEIYINEEEQSIEKNTNSISAAMELTSSNVASVKESNESMVQEGTEWYRSMKLNISWITSHHSCLKHYKVGIENKRNRPYIKCLKCEKYEYVAKKFARNGIVPIASGIRVESKERLKLVVDHLLSDIHKKVEEHETLELKWKQGSLSHPWTATLTKQPAHVMEFLIRLAFDVYSDSLIETASAFSWPARSLTQLSADRFIAIQRDEGIEAQIPSFRPQASQLHYRDPVHYGEMLECVAKIERMKLKERMDKSLVFSAQIDGSVSRTMRDNKFVSCRALNQNLELQTWFLGVHAPSKDGAGGLLQCLLAVFEELEIDTNKFAGVTTDGESANTGKHGGLWRLLSDHFDRKMLSFWCCAHRSDLAIEQVISTVPELKIWKANLKSVATYFRTSSKRTKELEQISPNARKFPRHHDVRFAQHFCQLIDAVLLNLDASRQVWTSRITVGDRKDKAEAQGYLRTWQSSQTWLTALMGDLFEIFQHMQQQMQRNDLILPDVYTLRDAAVRKLRIMKNGPLPGKREIKISNATGTTSSTQSSRNSVNQFIPTLGRDKDAIRIEIIQSAENFLLERLDMAQDRILKSTEALLKSKTCDEFVKVGSLISDEVFPEDTGVFVDECCDLWDKINDVLENRLPTGSDTGVTFSNMLRQLLPVCQGTKAIGKVIGAMLTLTPHSMHTERIVSHHNTICDPRRSCLKESTINNRMMVALNGEGTSTFDPRPAVADFLKMKDRRYREPDVEVYARREFAVKFFKDSF